MLTFVWKPNCAMSSFFYSPHFHGQNGRFNSLIKLLSPKELLKSDPVSMADLTSGRVWSTVISFGILTQTILLYCYLLLQFAPREGNSIKYYSSIFKYLHIRITTGTRSEVKLDYPRNPKFHEPKGSCGISFIHLLYML